MVERHVREGQVAIDRQRAVVARLTELKLPDEKAKAFLAMLESIQAEHIAHLGRL
ncbi:hypothetical protein SAZ10_29510 [Mesorhizobium sp. BAC0120]|uniref:hypothetical protein n=1 Tax=Mesorhizobium sp. BAC0120 TaxID=3090670 RepID=UPI00298C93F3|nr:hypothetical protein [Mesorhizobium sp. BAC0120]MDW6025904.1 hypothetical protein [Mesorhizobium sp. BAC0120]